MDTLTLAPAGVGASVPSADVVEVHESLKRLEAWIESHNYEAYEPFDCLSSPLRRFTRHSLLLDRILQQVGRQSPINVRPLIGVKPLPSTKGRGYMASGYLKMYAVTARDDYRERAVRMLEWLVEHKSPKFKEYSWANHFDYTSRGGHYSTHESIIVWTALIGQAFLDAFEMLGEPRYLEVADSACRWILALPREETNAGCCISYHSLGQNSVHNASMLGAALLARTWRHTRKAEYRALADAAMEYSCTRQLPDGAWWYGESQKYQWIDNFHTGYNLDSLQCYVENTGDEKFSRALTRGFEYFLNTFFEPSGRPRYYHDRAQPIDIQCASQAIETLTKFAPSSDRSLPTALRVAKWTIEHMQDADGHFYYRRYPLIAAKAPMLHWGQATMYHALALLLQAHRATFR
jgi:polysaccharide biosynthesis protein VpsJ